MKPIYRLPQTPMDDETSRIFLSMLMIAQLPDVEEIRTDISNDLESFTAGAALKKRVAAFKIEVKPEVLIVVAAICPNFGSIAMYTHALWHIAQRKGEVNMENFAHAFANGFPNEDELSKAWDSQKLATGGNFVDQPSLYSIDHDN